jgi:adenylate kinase family enzyme
MRRIAIVGAPASGKSTLAERLGAALGIQAHHLDALYWRPGCRATPEPEWDALHRRLVEGSAWIIDGGFTRWMPARFAAADTVVLLDPSPVVCIASAVWRRILFRRTRAPGMAADCRPHFDLEFLGWIWNFRRDQRPGILELVAEQDATSLVVLNGRGETRRWLESVVEQTRTETRPSDQRVRPEVERRNS